MSDVNRCASGPGRCRGTVLTPDGSKLAAETSDILCEPCLDSIRHHITDIPRIWVALHEAIGEHTRNTAQKVSGSRTPPININCDVDALKTGIVEWLTLAAARVADELGIDEPMPHNNTDTEYAKTVEKCARIINPNLDLLIAAPAGDAQIWLPPTDTEYPGERLYVDQLGITHHGTRIVEVTGLDIAQQLVRLRRRALAVLGVTTPRDKLPYPCPGCNRPELSRHQRKDPGRREVDEIVCGNCQLCWPYSRYQQLCLILAKEDEMERDKLTHQLNMERQHRQTVEWLLAEARWRFQLALECTDIPASEFAATVLAATR